MQVFRLMGAPDKVIAFDSLPARLLQGFELIPAVGFPRHWKEWMGKTKRVINVPPERDPLTQQIRKFDPIYEEDYFFYLVDWNLKPVEEKWNEVCDFVRAHVDKDVRLKEKFEEMAVPLAPNKTDGVSIEPEEVLVIEIPEAYQEKDGVVKKVVEANVSACPVEGCKAEFEGPYSKNALRMHTQKKHKVATAA